MHLALVAHDVSAVGNTFFRIGSKKPTNNPQHTSHTPKSRR